jgi:hypothetical protein
MGRGVLAPAATFDGSVMLAATVVHFALSIVYGLILAAAISRLGPLSSFLAGAAFGLLLYAVNLYGFTTLFPWFEATRDAVTVAAHVAFGTVAAGAYRALAYRFRS